MGEIKSALEIALEKTANIQGDSASGDTRELKNAGKKAAGDFLASGDADALKKALSKKDDEQAKTVREGALSIILASLRLPASEADLPKIATIGQGLDALLPKQGMKELLAQVSQIFSQYLAEREQLGKALEQQFMPKLRAKQQEMAKRYGQTLPIEPTRDSEYMAALSKNQRMIDAKYEEVIAEVRARVRETAGIEE